MTLTKTARNVVKKNNLVHHSLTELFISVIKNCKRPMPNMEINISIC